MKDVIGIRRETKDKTEHRAPLTPDQVRRLVDEEYLTVIVEPSDTRIFTDKEYRAAGAKVSELRKFQLKIYCLISATSFFLIRLKLSRIT